MFTKQDIEIMSLPYFDILFASDDHYEIKSICTGHSWKLIPKGSNCILQHKHYDSDEYHFQSGCYTVFDALLDIIEHDDYQLNCRSFKHRNKNTEAALFFDKLVKTAKFQS